MYNLPREDDPDAVGIQARGMTRADRRDDHPIVREGLIRLINGESDMIVSADVLSAREAMESLAADVPDVATIDISLADRNGVELIKDIVTRHPSLPAWRCRCTMKTCTRSAFSARADAGM